MRDVWRDGFLIGVALEPSVAEGRPAEARDLAARHFSSLTPENVMKWERVHPEPERYDFKGADALVAFAEKNGMKVIGHALVWHSQTPDWVFQGAGGGPATREELLERMKRHIRAVAGRYRGRIHGWDVVNEALADGGEEPLRDSPWRRIIGPDFIEHAFRFAHEAAPDAELYYNDYGLDHPRKRENCLKLLRGLLEKGVPVHGVGSQSHHHLNWPELGEIERTIRGVSALGLKMMVTELDVDVLPWPRETQGNAGLGAPEAPRPGDDPYPGGLPDDVQQALARRYGDLFALYRNHADVITRVTFWGLDDGRSWLNHFPRRGRTNHPLLFDRQLRPKPAFAAVVEAAAGRPAKQAQGK